MPGKEEDCVRYDDLKAAIKTQLKARWGQTGDGGSASESDEEEEPSALEEGLLASTEEARLRRRRAFYTLLGAELRRVARQYDASLAQLRRKVASLLGEARRGSVLDSLQLGDQDGNDGGNGGGGNHAFSSPDRDRAGGGGGGGGGSPTGSPAPHRSDATQQELDRAFRHVYHEVTLAR